ncbi:DUF3085 domain-containing protein [Photobacterium rosenbergii]|uniref:DUF3085 domain-containing protein n=1 Tax=Photobacterium rosenbergii TaxID=294936 RepID=UPI0039826FA2
MARPLGSTSSSPSEATISLVHNQGVFLIVHSKIDNPCPKNNIDYAEGCNPFCDEEWYITSRLLVGGEGFIQELPPEWFESLLLNDKKTFALNITDREVITI